MATEIAKIESAIKLIIDDAIERGVISNAHLQIQEPIHNEGFSHSFQETRAHDILDSMAKTFKERNAVYGDNYKMVGHLMQTLHPTGFVQSTVENHELGHLWSLLIVKLSRFAISGLTHKDSIHDLAVYAAMIEAILTNRRQDAD